MLNELYDLTQALRPYGMLKSSHPDVATAVNGDYLLVDLAPDGAVADLRLVIDDPKNPGDEYKPWKHTRGNHHSFPMFLVKKPLLAPAVAKSFDHASWNRLTPEKRLAALAALDFSALGDGAEIYISDWTLEQFAFLQENAVPELAGLKRLVDCFPRKAEAGEFTAKLAMGIHRALDEARDKSTLDAFRKLLVGIPDKKGDAFRSDVTLVFDVATDLLSPDPKVRSSQTETALIAALGQAGSEGGGPRVVSALSRLEVESVGDKYPQVILPRLGKTYFYSKKESIGCLARYGLKSAAAFASGKAEINAILDAVNYIRDPELYGKIWKGIPDCTRDMPNLLIVYSREKPQFSEPLATALTEADFEVEEENYQRICEQILCPEEDERRQFDLQVIVLEPLDKGRKQVLYTREFSAGEFADNLRDWLRACENLPPTLEPLYQKLPAGQKPTFEVPSPGQIIRLLKIVTSCHGNEIKISNCPAPVDLAAVYRLCMPGKPRSDDDAFYTRLLRHALERFGPLLLYCGARRTAGGPLTRFGDGMGENWRTALPLLGAILWKMKLTREVYMQGVPFNLGRLLRLADEIHKQYCIVVRNDGNPKKPLPAQFCGMEMLIPVSQSPAAGLVRLRDRLKPYLNWAKTYTGEQNKLVGWFLAQLGETAALVAAQELPESFGPADQAQVLLGYLASLPTKTKEEK